MSGEFHKEDDELLGTSVQLIAHIDNLVTEGELALNPLETGMLYLLAKRIDNGRGVDPISYVTSTEILINDCVHGKDSYTDEPMPANVTGLHHSMGSIFRMQAQNAARGAFGETFAYRVDEVYDNIRRRADEQNPPVEE